MSIIHVVSSFASRRPQRAQLAGQAPQRPRPPLYNEFGDAIDAPGGGVAVAEVAARVNEASLERMRAMMKKPREEAAIVGAVATEFDAIYPQGFLPLPWGGSFSLT